MTKPLDRYSIAQVRDRLTRIVHDVEKGQSVEITRRGKPVAVILSVDEYERVISGKIGFGKSLEKFRQDMKIEELGINPDEIFGNLRDRSPGREVTL
ncbi:type II toxin-antitoxin system Phd/YefM family antitoxin [Pseudanabaena sp. PCC 6802]|uniref:type II toxin-antitoxin system Phd/YefM family antitoxin n=1 Tax=Pseudanabaena sp. PCC 6802 TaxID=118173 RepID=UPI000348150E|nr:type II toxin-antitoxin system Phd/YefM family antitoxin [Pseudanabaena sp. PCC 6802]